MIATAHLLPAARQGLRALSAFAASALLLTLALNGAALAQVSAAKVMAVAGSAKAIDAQGHERLLEKGGEVRTGERIVTPEGALVQLRLNDGGYLSVRPGTDMVIDRFVLDEKDASKSNFLVSLVKGGFRSITGLIGRTNPSGYQIRAGTSTLGVRGTDHEPMMIPDGLPAMAKLGAPGLYDKVNDGETFIRNAGGMLALKRGEIGFSPLNTDKPPQPLRNIPDFYKTEIKIDARDPKDTNNNTDEPRKVDAGAMLRPSTAARRAALNPGNAPGVVPNTPPLVAPPTTLINPAIARVETPPPPLAAPTTTLLAPTVAPIAPIKPLIPPTNIVPTVPLIAPSTTITPNLNLVAPTTTNLSR